ncbi:MAG: DUF1585 domain-containing protein [Verrucomicrobiales bacterium]
MSPISEGHDEIVVDRLMATVAKDGYRMQTVISEVVTSYPFLNRRLPETAALRPMRSGISHRSPHLKLERRRRLLALPLLETMGWAESAKGKPFQPPVRLGFICICPTWVIMDQFWPQNPELLSAPPPALESLRPVLDRAS